MIDSPPAFFPSAPVIRVHDPLAAFLGATSTGRIEYHYADAVALAGHSCPTVAAAFLMTRAALNTLYTDALPERGNIRVAWREERTAGVTGVMANVVGLITGAADGSGFKGIGGRFERCGLLAFGVPMDDDVTLTRVDNHRSVGVCAELASVPMAPAVRELMPQCLNGEASAEEQREFRILWQDRVERLLTDHADDPEVIRVRSRNSVAA